MQSKQIRDVVKNFWETCRPFYAHMSYEIKEGSRLEKYYKEKVFDKIDFQDKTVIDYGCGAGWIGLYLYQHKGIEKYIGIDIAERGLTKAKAILGSTNAEFYSDNANYKEFDADVFMSISCIQHFPDVKYLNDFLFNINRGGYKTVMLHIRYNDKTISNDGYITDHVGSACLTNEAYISNDLTNYKLVSKDGIDKLYEAQYLIYEL